MRSGTLGVVLVLISLTTSPAPAGDAVNGEKVFNVSCAFCHRLTRQASGEIRLKEDRQAELRQGLANRPRAATEPPRPEVKARDLPDRGPHLAGLFSRPPGAVERFRYTFAYQIEGPLWSEAELDDWIAIHARINNKDERADLIAYLKIATAR
jgi:cytochrome c2